ncbi:unnamed protein product [Brassica oleracea var. botrytis]|uniref:(rape) hypothetical protein n=1 Tax=Brassica napus TaxID=3708 RepID=A0A816K9B6_BRANA|nr:unnamed protein product [Brassica napus]
MDESIREMHGRDFGDRVISVNRAELKMGRDDGKVTALELVAETVAIHLLAREALVAVLTVIPTRDIVSSAGSDRYGGGRAGVHIRGGDEGRGFRSRAGGPYERPSRNVGGGGHMSSATFDRY